MYIHIHLSLSISLPLSLSLYIYIYIYMYIHANNKQTTKQQTATINTTADRTNPLGVGSLRAAPEESLQGLRGLLHAGRRGWGARVLHTCCSINACITIIIIIIIIIIITLIIMIIIILLIICLITRPGVAAPARPARGERP